MKENIPLTCEQICRGAAPGITYRVQVGGRGCAGLTAKEEERKRDLTKLRDAASETATSVQSTGLQY